MVIEPEILYTRETLALNIKGNLQNIEKEEFERVVTE